MAFREMMPPASKSPTPPSHLCNGHCACSGYGTRANCPPLIILATILVEDPIAAAIFPSTYCPARSQQA